MNTIFYRNIVVIKKNIHIPIKSSITETRGADTIEVSISNFFNKAGTKAPIVAPNIIFISIATPTSNAILWLFIIIYVPAPPISPQNIPVTIPTKTYFNVLFKDVISLFDNVIIVIDDDCIPILPPKHNITGKKKSIFT